MNKPTVTYSSASLFEMGLSQVVIARFKNAGRVEMGVFLLDTLCLGVKNAFFVQGVEEDLHKMLEQIAVSGGPLEEHSGAWGRKLVESAVRYAQRLGISPHRDYKKAARVLGGIDPTDCPETFTFGHDGKPHFMAGPNDTIPRCRLILNILTKKLGQDGFNFTMPKDVADVLCGDEYEVEDDEDDDEMTR